MTDLERDILVAALAWIAAAADDTDQWELIHNGVPMRDIGRQVLPPAPTAMHRKRFGRALEALDAAGKLLRVDGGGGRTVSIKILPPGVEAILSEVPEAELQRALRLLRKCSWFPKGWRRPASKRKPRAGVPKIVSASAATTVVVALGADVPQVAELPAETRQDLAVDQTAGDGDHVAQRENGVSSCANGSEHGREPAAQATEGPEEPQA